MEEEKKKKIRNDTKEKNVKKSVDLKNDGTLDLEEGSNLSTAFVIND